jgi:hypothetical protein
MAGRIQARWRAAAAPAWHLGSSAPSNWRPVRQPRHRRPRCMCSSASSRKAKALPATSSPAEAWTCGRSPRRPVPSGPDSSLGGEGGGGDIRAAGPGPCGADVYGCSMAWPPPPGRQVVTLGQRH